MPLDNFDVPRWFARGVTTPRAIRVATRDLLSFVDGYDEIRTNRLHVALAGAMLGKSVQLYANDYYKIEAIYRHSIAPRFDNVVWMGRGY